MSPPGRHIKSYGQVQSLSHEAFMKILLKILKERSWMGGKEEKRAVFGPRELGSQGTDFLHFPLLHVSRVLKPPTFVESRLVTGLISIHH